MKKILAIFWMPATLLLINFIALTQGVYDNVSWFDDIMHALGGISIAHMFLKYVRVYEFSWWKSIPWYASITFTVCVAVMFGVAWEWYEFISDTYFATRHQPSMPDTMNDLFLALVGSFIYSCQHLLRNKK